MVTNSLNPFLFFHGHCVGPPYFWDFLEVKLQKKGRNKEIAYFHPRDGLVYDKTPHDCSVSVVCPTGNEILTLQAKLFCNQVHLISSFRLVT
jgi:hypothetical protein